MATWKDVSSYSRGDKERVPSIWEARIGWARVTVHRYLGLDGWFVSAHGLMVNRVPLTANDVDDAKCEALRFLRDHLAPVVAALPPEEE